METANGTEGLPLPQANLSRSQFRIYLTSPVIADGHGCDIAIRDRDRQSEPRSVAGQPVGHDPPPSLRILSRSAARCAVSAASVPVRPVS